MPRLAAVLAAAVALSGVARAETTEGAEKFLFELRFPFEVGASVTAVAANGETRELGRVVMLPETTRWPSYTASAWGTPGSVCATAVNALHMLVGVEDGKGRTMSIIPSETIAPAAGAGAALVIDTKAGTGPFGAWAPPSGSEVTVERGDRSDNINAPTLISLRDELPKEGDTLVIRVVEEAMPYMVDFENRPGGRVIAWNERGASVIARVVRRLGGCGRFAGTVFQDEGRIRADHSGVIDVSTCAYGETGGFQIIPWDHALTSEEMQGAWNATQWLVIAPTDLESNMGGTHPLFAGALVPGTARDEQLWDIWSTYGRKPLVLARIKGGEWTKFPIASGKDDEAFRDVTHIRIYFPFTDEPMTR